MTTDIENAINSILGIARTDSELTKRRGRRPNEVQPVWSLNFYEPDKNITYALISMCIKEDFGQTLGELAARVSACKGRPKAECLRVLKNLSECGKLGYYDDYSQFFCTWKGAV